MIFLVLLLLKEQSLQSNVDFIVVCVTVALRHREYQVEWTHLLENETFGKKKKKEIRWNCLAIEFTSV